MCVCLGGLCETVQTCDRSRKGVFGLTDFFFNVPQPVPHVLGVFWDPCSVRRVGILGFGSTGDFFFLEFLCVCVIE